jgi:hypothetical protein
VARRAAEVGRLEECLRLFDAAIAAGEFDGDAAYFTLKHVDALDDVDLPGYPAPPMASH